MDGKPILKQLAPYKQGKQTDEIKAEYNLTNVIKLASNENPFGYSNKVNTALSTSDNEFNIYPDGHTSELRTALADRLQVEETELVFGSGSDEIIQTISRAYLYPGANIVAATPTFPQYKHNALIEGAEVKEVPTVDGNHDLDSMFEAIDEQTAIVWLCSPDNPTGTVISKDSLDSFLKKCPKNVLVVVDEAYYEYVNPALELEVISNLKKYPNLILLRTFSKAYGLAGLRIGYGIMDKAIATKLDIVRGPFNTSAISQKAALVALEDTVFIEEIAVLNRQIKGDFEQFLTSIGWHYYESETNFLLVTTPISGLDVSEYLLTNGFIIRPGEVLGYPNTIRITIGNEEDMLLLQNVIKELHLQISNEV